MACVFFFQAEDGIRDKLVTGVQTCALPICNAPRGVPSGWPRGVGAECTAPGRSPGRVARDRRRGVGATGGAGESRGPAGVGSRARPVRGAAGLGASRLRTAPTADGGPVAGDAAAL